MILQKQGLVRVDKFPLIIFITLCFLKGTKEEMDALESRFLAGSYSPVGCTTTEPLAEASDIGKKPDSTTRTEPPKKKAKKGNNKENSGIKAGKQGQKNKQRQKKKPKGRLKVSFLF